VSSTEDCSTVTIYTDGACLGNPGPGGWAAVLLSGNRRKEISGAAAGTTNNRMELKAAIEGLKQLKRSCRVVLITDSRYLHDALERGWLEKWRRNGWKTASRSPVKNQDLWRELHGLLQRHRVDFRWTRGHQGTEENERCDELARRAARGQKPSPGGSSGA
jgi:ribonuclease HI